MLGEIDSSMFASIGGGIARKCAEGGCCLLNIGRSGDPHAKEVD
jgi:hypothetical protein